MGSRAFLFKLLQDIRASYWFLPSTLVCLAVFLSQCSLYLDQNPNLLPFEIPEGLRDTQVDGARSLMTTISQSVFGVAGVMFSMTIVAVSFASGNFGPRLIGNFMRDRGNQWSLGILIATFVYALMITRAIQSPNGEGTELFVPHLSIMIALGLTFVSIFTVIYFVHHIPETINVSNITASLGQKLIADIKSVIDAQGDEDREAVALPDRDPDKSVALEKTGYIQTLNTDQLRSVAREHELIIDVCRPVGAFVTEYTTVMQIWGSDISDDCVTELRNSFALGKSQTENHNLLFIVAQLVEMIARALSPGVNDPFTAINCLNWLHAAVTAASNHNGGLRDQVCDAVHTSSLSFDDVFQSSFGASLNYIKTDALCTAHVRYLIAALDAQIEDPDHKKTLATFSAELDT
ncbi:DUF2254 domain-containing protein [Tateyamaria pelophila]|uniref:DUF2254 domain-containing protein n=1 Tax=Tateyamaria pelophila TaxID=328415 RepID=UPI001CBBDB6D|nr:DUF2254 domain-containing protein [Tateyamaria pelophila]